MKNKTYQYSTEVSDGYGDFEITVEYTVSRGSPAHWSCDPALCDEGSPDLIEDLRVVSSEKELSEDQKDAICDYIHDRFYDELIEETLDWEN